MFHKNNPAKIITIIFAILIIGQTFAFLIISLNLPAEAEGIAGSRNPLDNLQVEIPGLENLAKEHPATCDGTKCTIPWIGIYVSAIYRYAIGSVGLLATVVMMYAGVLWITAAGNSEQIGKAKSYMASSLTGMILALCSYMILYQVNPDLLQFKPIEVKQAIKAPEKEITPATDEEMDKIKERCDSECAAGYDYDAKTDQCNCWGTGTHKECQLVRGTSYDTYECVTLNTPGEDTCNDNSECTKTLGCCQCIWRTMWVTLNTTCTSGANFTSYKTCADHCGWIPDKKFTSSSICNSDDQCIKQ